MLLTFQRLGFLFEQVDWYCSWTTFESRQKQGELEFWGWEGHILIF